MKSLLTTLRTKAIALWNTTWTYAVGHKVIASIATIVVLGGAYWGYSALTATPAVAEYVLTHASIQPIQSTVTASGQVAADHQLDLTAKASGEVTGVYVTTGEQVHAGQLVASIDATDALKSVRDAQLSLQSAQISYTQAITSAQNSTDNSATSVTSARDSGFDAVTSAQNNLSTITTGIHDLLYNGTDLKGYAGDVTMNAYVRLIQSSEPSAGTVRDRAKASYDAAKASYDKTFAAYQLASRTSSPEDIQALLTQTQDTATKTNQAVKDTRAFFELVRTTVTEHNLLATPPSLSSQISTLDSYTSTSNSTASSLTSAQSSLTTAIQEHASNTQSIDGGTPLAIQSAELTLAKARQALADANTTLADYSVRAPFDGTIAEVDVQKFDQTSGKVATLITKEQYATISLNEADITNVRVGETATLTFDAVSDLTINGTVAQVNQIGTVSQGVTTYTVKIGFDTQDARVKPGMTVNATIVTASKDQALVVPSTAIKTQNGQTYVEVATVTTDTASSTTNRPAYSGANAGMFGSSTRTGRMGSTTATTTAFAERTQTVPVASVTTTRVPVTIGIVGDTTTEVTSGLTAGERVVSQSLTASGQAAATQSKGLFSLFGGSRASGSGSARTTASGAGARTTSAAPAGAARPGGF